jgi:homeobox-leucine zipper protein
MDSSGKYVRYTNEQVEALERVYHECPKPSSIRRHQLIKESPILSNIEPKQIKVWFQNRRYGLSIWERRCFGGFNGKGG